MPRGPQESMISRATGFASTNWKCSPSCCSRKWVINRSARLSKMYNVVSASKKNVPKNNAKGRKRGGDFMEGLLAEQKRCRLSRRRFCKLIFDIDSAILPESGPPRLCHDSLSCEGGFMDFIARTIE